MRRISALLIGLMFASLAGCNSNAYFKDRGHDFLDMFSVDVAGGAGLGLHGKAAIFNTGLGYGQMYHAGLMENGPGTHNWFAVRPEQQLDVIVRTNSSVMKGEPSPFNDNPFQGTWLQKGEKASSHKCLLVYVPGMDPATAEPTMKWWDVLDAELSANALVVGARAGLRPGQMFDFVLGWFTVDFTGDDTMEGCCGQPAKK